MSDSDTRAGRRGLAMSEPKKVPRNLRKSRRFGRFHIATGWVLAGHTAVQRIMGLCTVMRAESLLELDVIEYFARSDHFRLLDDGEILPEYRWIIDSDGFISCEEVK